MSERENAIRRYERALLRTWDNADEYARTYAAEWYEAALQDCTRIADDNGFTVRQVVGACAALSPRVHWAENIADTRALCEWAADLRDDTAAYFVPLWGLRLRAFSAQQEKASLILSVDDPLTVLHGPKERAFYRNIMGDTDHVTVDTWATRAATYGKSVHPAGQYDAIAQAYRRAARKVGQTPRDFQAGIWVAARGSSV